MKKLLAIIAVLGAVCCMFAGCGEEEPVEEPTVTPVVENTPAATELPDIDIAHDETKFVMDGVILKAYIGNEETVEIPEGTVIIDANAFRDCTTVKTVTFKNSVTEIGDYAFYGCTGLTEISLPGMVTKVGDYAFAECTALTKFESKTNTSDIGKGAFFNCSALESAVLSLNINVLQESTFEGCSALKTLSFDKLTKLEDRVFYGCASLESIKAPGLIEVEDEAFYGCSAFADASDFKKISSVGYDAFEGTKWLTEAKAKADAPTVQKDAFVTIGNGILVYYSNVIVEEATKAPSADATEAPDKESEKDEGDGLVALQLDFSVKGIAPGALAKCADEIEKIELESTVNYIGKAAFKDFKKLQYIELSRSIVDIPEYAFAGCENLVTVIMQGKVTSIGESAFEGCVSLNAVSQDKPKKVTQNKDEDTATDAPETESVENTLNVHNVEPVIDLRDSVAAIGKNAFKGCKAVTSLKTSEKLLSIDDYAFFGCEALVIEDASVAFGENLSYVGASAFVGTPSYENYTGRILVVGNGVLIKAADDYDYDMERAENTIEEKGINYICSTLNGMTEIPEKLFYNGTKVSSIVIPEGVTTIKAYAFYHAENLKSIVIPSTVTTIEANAFAGCVNLETIVLPEGIKEIADYAFYGCAKLSDINIPDSVEKIGKYAFYNCVSLNDVEVPAGVKEIGAFAFDGTPWFELNNDKFFVVGDGILIKYTAYEKETVFTAEDPVVKAIVGGAFEGTYRLESIVLPETCTVIGDFAFSGSTTVKSITAAGATAVGARAFNNCIALTETKLAAGAAVAEDAYHGCEAYEK